MTDIEVIEMRIKGLKERKSRMVQYLELKVEAEDWHGAADACMDIRDIESEILAYSDCKDNICVRL